MIWQELFLGFFESDRAFFTACTEIVTTIVLATLAVKLYGRYKQRQNLALRYLVYTTVFLSLTACLQLTDQFIFDPVFGTQSIGYSLAFATSAIANIFMVWFMLEIFFAGRSSGGWKASLIIGVEAAVAILSPIIGPFFMDYHLYVILVHMVFAVILYFIFVNVTSKAILKTTDPVTRKGFSYLRLAGITITLAYVSFILDRVWTVAWEVRYSYWVIIGWIFSAFVGVFFFLGFTYPAKAQAQAQTQSEAK